TPFFKVCGLLLQRVRSSGGPVRDKFVNQFSVVIHSVFCTLCDSVASPASFPAPAKPQLKPRPASEGGPYKRSHLPVVASFPRNSLRSMWKWWTPFSRLTE